MIKVIKIGGNIVDNPELLAAFVKDFAAMPGMKVLIHGGGVMASQMQKSMGMTPVMVEGRRVTDEATLKVVTMVYAGWCNKNIVALLQGAGCNSIGLCGADGNVIRAIMENELSQIESRHMGWIGLVTAWGGYAPGFGMIGTVLGLIGMLNNLEDKSSLGPNMAVALITTLYGSMMANWLIAPFSAKLASHNAMEMRTKEMIIEGVLAIQAGENPRIMGQKLLTYLEPVTRKVVENDVLKD